MRYLFFLPLILILASCATPTSQSHILAQAKAEVSKRENWGDRAFIRVERRPDDRYMYWRDYSWKVSAGAVDYTDYPSYNGINLIAGTERELRFSRSGCLVGYKRAIRPCRLESQTQTILIAPAPMQPDK